MTQGKHPIYAELDAAIPGWRTQFKTFDAAVAAADLQAECTAIRSKMKVELETTSKMSASSVFDNSRFGERHSGEREDEAGAEDFRYRESGADGDHDDPAPSSVDLQFIDKVGAVSGGYRNLPSMKGLVVDSLFYDEDHSFRALHSGRPLKFNPIPPRELGSIKCF